MEKRKFTEWLKANKEKRGGKREGAGRKQKYNEETKVVTFRIPLSKVNEIKEIVNDKLKEYK